MLVFRYEYLDTGIGPYISWGHAPDADRLNNSLHDAHDNRDGLRMIVECAGFSGVSNWRSACDSPEALTRWFFGYNKKLKKAGYRVVSYRVTDEELVIQADGQLAVHSSAMELEVTC